MRFSFLFICLISCLNVFSQENNNYVSSRKKFDKFYFEKGQYRNYLVQNKNQMEYLLSNNDPDFIETQIKIANSYLQLEVIDSAKNIFNSIEERDLSISQCKNLKEKYNSLKISILLKEENYEEAKILIDDCFEKNTIKDSLTWLMIYYYSALVDIEKEQYDEAFNKLTYILERLETNFSENYLQYSIRYEIACLYLRKKDYYSAIDNFNNIISNCEEYSNLSPYILFYTFFDISVAYYYIGDYYNSLKHYLLAYNKFDRTFIKDIEEEKIVLSIGNVYKIIGNYNHAIQYYSIIKENATVLSSIATCYYKLGDKEGTIKNYLKAFETKNFNSITDEIIAKISYSKDCSNNAKINTAQKYATDAIKTSYDSKAGLTYQNYAFINIASFHNKIRQPDSSFFYLNLVFDSYNKLYRELQYFDTYSFKNIILSEAYTIYADALILKCNRNTNSLVFIAQALDYYRKAIDIIEERKSFIQNKDSRNLLSSEKQEVYDKCAITALNLYDLTNNKKYKDLALYYAELPKYNTLLYSMNKNKALEEANIPDSLYKRLHYLKNAIYRCEAGNGHSAKGEQLENLIKLQSEHDLLEKDIEKKYPGYKHAASGNTITNPLSIQNRLDNEQCVLDYVLLDSMLAVFYIDKNNFDVRLVRSDQSIDTLVATVTGYLNSPKRKADGVYQEYLSASRKLYKYLIEPFEKEIQSRQLIVVPGGILSYLPFEILLTSDPDQQLGKFASLPYLIRQNSISYKYSLNLVAQEEKQVKQEKELLAMAPGFSENNDLKFLTENIYRSGLDLSPLPNSTREIESIGSYFESLLAEGKQATKKFLMNNADKYNILHFATHTIIDDNFPMYSKIVLSKDSTDEDAFLNTYEIYNMHLNADLVVLSGCQTGYGKLYKGEGLSGLSNGFIHAGCRSLVATLWKQEDKAAYELVTAFYKYLKDGDSKDIALQKAKLDYLDNCAPEKASPHFWAGFVLIGENNPVVSSGGKILPAIVVILIILFLSVMVMSHQRRKS